MEWTGWEMWVSNLIVDEKKVEEGEDPDFAESFARIETHYFTHCGFFHKENQLIEDVDKIRDIPATIYHCAGAVRRRLPDQVVLGAAHGLRAARALTLPDGVRELATPP